MKKKTLGFFFKHNLYHNVNTEISSIQYLIQVGWKTPMCGTLRKFHTSNAQRMKQENWIFCSTLAWNP